MPATSGMCPPLKEADATWPTRTGHCPHPRSRPSYRADTATPSRFWACISPAMTGWRAPSCRGPRNWKSSTRMAGASSGCRAAIRRASSRVRCPSPAARHWATSHAMPGAAGPSSTPICWGPCWDPSTTTTLARATTCASMTGSARTQCGTKDMTACISRCGRPMPHACPWSATSTAGTAAVT